MGAHRVIGFRWIAGLDGGDDPLMFGETLVVLGRPVGAAHDIAHRHGAPDKIELDEERPE